MDDIFYTSLGTSIKYADEHTVGGERGHRTMKKHVKVALCHIKWVFPLLSDKPKAWQG